MFLLFSFRSITPSHIDSLLRLLSGTNWQRDELILAAAAVGLVLVICVGAVGAAVVLRQSLNAAKTSCSASECAPAPAGMDASSPPNRAARLRRGW